MGLYAGNDGVTNTAGTERYTDLYRSRQILDIQRGLGDGSDHLADVLQVWGRYGEISMD